MRLNYRVQYFPFKLVSAVAESKPRIYLCPSSFTLTLHKLQVAHDLCLRLRTSSVPVVLALRYLAGGPSNGHHLCPQALRHVYHGSVPQPSSFNPHQTVHFLRSSRGRATSRPTVLCIQFPGPHVCSSGTPQNPLKTITSAVRVGTVPSSKGAGRFAPRRGEQPQPRLNFDTALQCAQRRRPARCLVAHSCANTVVLNSMEGPVPQDRHNLVRPEPRPQSGAGDSIEGSIWSGVITPVVR